jgi:hypothetical protein
VAETVMCSPKRGHRPARGAVSIRAAGFLVQTYGRESE